MKNVFSHIGSGNGRIPKNLIRVASIGLCLALGSSLVACDGSIPSPISGGNNGGNQQDVETVSADQPFFSSKVLDFYQAAEKEEVYVVSNEIVKDKLLVLVSATTYDESFYNKTVEQKMAEVNPESVSEEAVIDETTAEESEAEVNTQESVEDKEASETVTDETATDETATDETVLDEEISEGDNYEEGYQGYTTKYALLTYSLTGELLSQTSFDNLVDSNSNILDFSITTDGNYKVLTRMYDPLTYEPTLQETVVDSAGKVIKEPVQIELKKGFDPYSVSYDEAGNRYFGGYMEKPTIVITDPNGKILFDISNDSLGTNVYTIDGKVYADGYDQKNNYAFSFFEIDVAGKKIGDALDMSFIMDQGMGILSGPDGMYYQSANGINKIDFEKKESTEIVAWSDCEIERQSYGGDQLIMLSDTTFISISSVYDEEKMTSTTTPYLLSKAATNPNAGKKIITVGGLDLSYDEALRKRIYDFNKNSTEYRIVTKEYRIEIDYSNFKSDDDYMNAYSDMINKMNLEITSGDGPDIIYGSYADFSLYESKGLLVDLYTLMNSESSFKKDDLLPGIVKACESDGKLYKLGAGFSISGLVGAKSVIGDRTGWTIEEFQQVADSLPEKMSMLSSNGYRQSDILSSVLYSSMGSFVNTATGTVSFDTDDFRAILKLAKDYGRDDDAIDDGSYWVDDRELVRNGELALMTAYVSSLYDYHDVVSTFGEPVSFVGYPSSVKTGTSCYMNAMFAISSESPSIDASWSFVQTFFTEEVQDQLADMWQIPVLRSSVEKSIQKTLDPENSQNMYYGYDGMEGTPINEESAEGYRTLVESVDVYAVMDPAILAIIQEEVAPYFNDQKSAEDVSKLIQNRVETIVKEKR